MTEAMIGYIAFSYFTILLLDIILIIFFDGKVSFEAITILLVAPISLPIIAIKIFFDLTK